MTKLKELIPDPDVLLALEPEELGGVLLSVIDKLSSNQHIHLQDTAYFDRGPIDPRHDQVEKAIREAFYWLKNEGLIVATSGSNGMSGWCELSRRGRTLQTPEAFDRYRKASFLPRELIHPTLLEKSWPLYLRGDHDAAVLNAFIQLEDAVRIASVLPNDRIGVKLMREAFHPDNGPLTDKTAVIGEREGLMNLFAGAIGSFKNPLSHRQVGLDASKGSAEMIVMASHLLRIVDDRVAGRNAPAAAQ